MPRDVADRLVRLPLDDEIAAVVIAGLGRDQPRHVVFHSRFVNSMSASEFEERKLACRCPGALENAGERDLLPDEVFHLGGHLLPPAQRPTGEVDGFRPDIAQLDPLPFGLSASVPTQATSLMMTRPVHSLGSSASAAATDDHDACLIAVVREVGVRQVSSP